MAIEVYGANADIAACVIGANKALRATAYAPSGEPKYGKPYFYGSRAFQVRVAAVTGIGPFVALQNNIPNIRVVMTLINLQSFFDGTAAATSQVYFLRKYFKILEGINNSLAIGSTFQQPSKVTGQFESGNAQFGASIQVFGLEGMYDYPRELDRFNQTRILQTATVFNSNRLVKDWAGMCADPIILDYGEAFVIEWGATQVIGDNLVGTIEWFEQRQT